MTQLVRQFTEVLHCCFVAVDMLTVVEHLRHGLETAILDEPIEAQVVADVEPRIVDLPLIESHLNAATPDTLIRANDYPLVSQVVSPVLRQ